MCLSSIKDFWDAVGPLGGFILGLIAVVQFWRYVTRQRIIEVDKIRVQTVIDSYGEITLFVEAIETWTNTGSREDQTNPIFVQLVNQYTKAYERFLRCELLLPPDAVRSIREIFQTFNLLRIQIRRWTGAQQQILNDNKNRALGQKGRQQVMNQMLELWDITQERLPRELSHKLATFKRAVQEYIGRIK